jgi:hypothetical protein
VVVKASSWCMPDGENLRGICTMKEKSKVLNLLEFIYKLMWLLLFKTLMVIRIVMQPFWHYPDPRCIWLLQVSDLLSIALFRNLRKIYPRIKIVVLFTYRVCSAWNLLEYVFWMRVWICDMPWNYERTLNEENRKNVFIVHNLNSINMMCFTIHLLR